MAFDDYNEQGQRLCRYCKHLATHLCTAIFNRGLHVCDRHICPECKPYPSTQEETVDEAADG